MSEQPAQYQARIRPQLSVSQLVERGPAGWLCYGRLMGREPSRVLLEALKRPSNRPVDVLDTSDVDMTRLYETLEATE